MSPPAVITQSEIVDIDSVAAVQGQISHEIPANIATRLERKYATAGPDEFAE